jgi:hypothetical protein
MLIVGQVFKTLWELTNEQIMVTREVYQEKFGQDLKEVLNKFTSGPFQLLTLMVVDKLRVEFGQLSVRIDGGYKLYKTQTPTPVCSTSPARLLPRLLTHNRSYPRKLELLPYLLVSVVCVYVCVLSRCTFPAIIHLSAESVRQAYHEETGS